MNSLGLILVSLIWGTTFVAVKTALDDASPLVFLGLRFSIASVLALLFVRARPGLKRGLLWGIPLGAVLAGAYAAQTVGLVTTTPARSAFITGINVVLIPVWGWILLGKRPGRYPVFGLLLAVPGIWLLTDPGVGRWYAGDSWTLLCAVLFALHVVLITRMGTVHYIHAILASQLAVTAVLALGGAAVVGKPRLVLTPEIVGALALTGVLASFLTTLIQLRLQPRVSPARTAILFAAEPVFAAIFSWIIRGESLGPAGWVGGGLILCGAVTSEVGSLLSSGRRGASGSEGPGVGSPLVPPPASTTAQEGTSDPGSSAAPSSRARPTARDHARPTPPDPARPPAPR
jgi:drug/metabolite transporter (DMT)-like permease